MTTDMNERTKWIMLIIAHCYAKIELVRHCFSVSLNVCIFTLFLTNYSASCFYYKELFHCFLKCAESIKLVLYDNDETN